MKQNVHGLLHIITIISIKYLPNETVQYSYNDYSHQVFKEFNETFLEYKSIPKLELDQNGFIHYQIQQICMAIPYPSIMLSVIQV